MAIAVRIRLFAIQRELAATREVRVELPDGADVEAAWAVLVARHPVLAPGRPSMRFARNGEYADPTTRLSDGDEVAMIPPVSGGSGDPERELGGPTRRIAPSAAAGRGRVAAWATTSGIWLDETAPMLVRGSFVACPATIDHDSAVLRQWNVAPTSLVAAAATRARAASDPGRHHP